MIRTNKTLFEKVCGLQLFIEFEIIEIELFSTKGRLIVRKYGV